VVPDAPGDDWAVVDIPGADEVSTSSTDGAGSADDGTSSADDNSSSADDGTSSAGGVSTSSADDKADDGRYGESVVRDLLGATLLKEERTGPIETVTPADTGAQVLPDAGKA
jgi:hypothetical protein